MTTIDHPGTAATTNFANSMMAALAGTDPADPAEAIAPVTTPPVPEPPKPPVAAPTTAAEPPKPAPVADGEDSQSQTPDIAKWPRTAQEWKKWNEVRETEYKKRDDKIAELAKKATEYEEKLKTVGTPAQHPEYESVKKERDQYSEALKTVAVENHPKFKEYYGGKSTAQIELAKRIVGPEKAELIAKALTLPEGDFRDRQVEELVSDLPQLKQSQIAGVLNNLTQLQSERQAAVADSLANYEKLQKDQQQKANESRIQLENQFTSTIKKLQSKEGSPLFQTRDGDDKWNQSVNDRVELAKHLLLGNPKPEQIIEAAANAAAYPALIQNQIALAKENEQLKAQIKSLSAASPTLAPKPASPTENGSVPGPVQIPANARPMDAVRPWMQSLGNLNQQ